MVFRLPTQLETFIPPPSAQVPQLRPWRGSVLVGGMRSDKSGNQELRMTAVETDGDNRADLWPSQFYAHITHGRPILREVQAWVKRHGPPLCTFMPDRLHDVNNNAVNQSHFRSLSRILFENQMVAITPWNTDKIPGAGIVIFPAQNSSALLVGALFLSSPFPDFTMALSPMATEPSPTAMLSRNSQYQQPMITPSASGYASSSGSRHGHSPHRSIHQSTDHPGAGQRRDQYRYIMPRAISNAYPTASSSGDTTWPVVKGEEDADYSMLSSGRGNYPHTGI